MYVLHYTDLNQVRQLTQYLRGLFYSGHVGIHYITVVIQLGWIIRNLTMKILRISRFRYSRPGVVQLQSVFVFWSRSSNASFMCADFPLLCGEITDFFIRRGWMLTLPSTWMFFLFKTCLDLSLLSSNNNKNSNCSFPSPSDWAKLYFLLFKILHNRRYSCFMDKKSEVRRYRGHIYFKAVKAI